MGSVLLDMAELLVRWSHVIFGIAWIGASFYFIWLDNSLQQPPPDKASDGVQGDLWSFHGGGIYEVSKYRAAPPVMPGQLHWFYWEAYSTWLSGVLLLALVYYAQADTFLFAPGGWAPSPFWSVVASVAYLAIGTLIYEALLRLARDVRPSRFALLMLGFSGTACWLAFALFSDRAAALHVGMLLGTIMVANVFIGIIPPQRAFVRAIDRGEPLPLAGLALAKLRSTHNNYFTLPVLLCMISNHYPVLYGHRQAALLLFLLLALSAGARHFFNLRHRGQWRPIILLASFLGFVALALWLSWDQYRMTTGAQTDRPMPDTEAAALVSQHCAVCHSPQPSWPGFSAPPLGLVLDTPEAIAAASARSATVVAAGYMPLGNVTGLTDSERAALLVWLSGR